MEGKGSSERSSGPIKVSEYRQVIPAIIHYFFDYDLIIGYYLIHANICTPIK
jgi:hypothetical protein